MSVAPTLTVDEVVQEAHRMAGLGTRQLVGAILQCTRLDAHGVARGWPAAATLRVRDLLPVTVNAAVFDLDRPLSGLEVAAVHVTQSLFGALCYYGRLAQGQELQLYQCALQAVPRLLEGDFEETVEAVMTNRPDAHSGVYQHLIAPHAQGWRRELPRCYEGMADRSGVQELCFEQPFEPGFALSVWRVGLVGMGSGEKLHDLCAVLSDARGIAATAWARTVHWAPRMRAAELTYMLDAYDSDGLALGKALERLVLSAAVKPEALFEGDLLHLQQLSVRQDLRGRGLGQRFASHALHTALSKHRRRIATVAMAVQSPRFEYPLQGLPADLLMRAQDETEALGDYLRDCQLLAQVPKLADARVLLLAEDADARGTHVQQLRLLAEPL